MRDDDYDLSPYWCPLCGEPRAVCDSHGGCGNWLYEDLDDDFDDEEADDNE